MNTTLLEQAGHYHRQGQLAKAMECYQQLLTEEPENAELLHAIAIIYAQMDDSNNALDTIEQALKLDSKNATLYNSKGNILLRKQDYANAASAYKKATKLKPNYAKAFNNLGNCLFHQDKLTAASKAYQKAIEFQPHYSDAYANYGILLTKESHYEKAVEQLKLALKYNEQHIKAIGQLGQIYLEQENYKAAVEWLEKRLKLAPDHAETWHSLGLAYLKLDDAVKAVAALEKALQLEPQHPDAEHQLGTAYLKLQQLDKATAHYIRQLENNPQPESYYNIGVLLMYQERNKEAIQYLARGLELDPTNFAAEINLGSIYLKLRQVERAKQHYQKALKLKPNDPETQYILAAISKDNTPKRAPNEFLQSLFDQYSGHYDKHLTEHLKYQVPEKLHRAVFAVTDFADDWKILDLGCGTGLAGAEFKPNAEELIGVDVSPEMINIAKDKHIYDELKISDLTTALDQYHDFDLIIAADVFSYIGELDEIFVKVKHALNAQSIFAFTVEAGKDYPYQLQQSARYAHSKKYLEEIIKTNQFETLSFETITLRQQQKQPVYGFFVVCRK